MADDPISGLAALGGAPATNDLFVVVDVSDTTGAPTGTTKKMTVANLFTSPAVTTPALTNPLITTPATFGPTGTTGALRGDTNYPGASIDPAFSANVADGSSIAIGDISSNGVLTIVTSHADMAVVGVTGSLLVSVIGTAIRGTWSAAAGTASSHNIYWDAGTSKYRLENRSGTGASYSIWRIGSFATQ